MIYAFGVAINSLAGAGMVLAYVGGGVASLLSGGHARTLGSLPLAPPDTFGVMLTEAVLFVRSGWFSDATMTWSAVALGRGQVLARIAVGYLLPTGSGSTEQVVPTADLTAKRR